MLTLVLVLAGIPLLIGIRLSARFGFYLGCAILVLISAVAAIAVSDLIYCSNPQIVGWENENYPIYDRDCGPGGLFVLLVLIVVAPIVAALSIVLMKLWPRIAKRPLIPRSL